MSACDTIPKSTWLIYLHCVCSEASEQEVFSGLSSQFAAVLWVIGSEGHYKTQFSCSKIFHTKAVCPGGGVGVTWPVGRRSLPVSCRPLCGSKPRKGSLRLQAHGLAHHGSRTVNGHEGVRNIFGCAKGEAQKWKVFLLISL